jgi:hypothetical protein
MEPPISTRLWAALRSRLTLMAPKTPPLVLARWSLETGETITPRLGREPALTFSGNSNTCLGHSAGNNLTTGEGNIYIGAQVQASDFDEFEFIRIGDDTAFTFPYDTFIAGIQNRAVDAGANPHIVLVDDNGKLGTVAVNEIGIKTNAQAMLNEFLKEHKKVEELEATVAQQQKGMEVLTAQLKEQAAQIKKVSAQIEMSKPASKVVVNEP